MFMNVIIKLMDGNMYWMNAWMDGMADDDGVDIERVRESLGRRTNRTIVER